MFTRLFKVLFMFYTILKTHRAIYQQGSIGFCSNPVLRARYLLKCVICITQNVNFCDVPLRPQTVCRNAEPKQNSDVESTQEAETISKIVTNIGNLRLVKSCFGSDTVTGYLSPSVVLQVLRRLDNSGKMALTFFRWAEKRKDFVHTTECYHALIVSLGKIRQFRMLWLLVDEMHLKGLLCKDTFILVSRRFARANRVKDAIDAFEKMDKYELKPDLHDYNKLLDTLTKSRKVQTAQYIFDEWKGQRFKPDIKSYSILLEGWGEEENFPRLKEVYCEMTADQLELDVVGYGILVNAYCKARMFNEAVDLCREMEWKKIEATPHIYCTLISGLGPEKRLNEAVEFFKLCKVSDCVIDVPTYNAMVGASCWSERIHDAYGLVSEMKKRGIGPESRTYDIILYHLVKLNRTHEAYDVFLKMSDEFGCEPTVRTYEITVRMFCYDELIDMALKIWDLMKGRGVIPGKQIFTVLINGLCDCNKVEDACKYFQEMLDLGIRPSDPLFKHLKRSLLNVGREDIVIAFAHKIDKLRGIPLVG